MDEESREQIRHGLATGNAMRSQAAAYACEHPETFTAVSEAVAAAIRELVEEAGVPLLEASIMVAGSAQGAAFIHYGKRFGDEHS